MLTFFFTWPPRVFATETVLVEGPVMMKDEKSSLNCKRKKDTFSLPVYHNGAVHKLCRLKGGGVKNCKF